MLIHLLNAVLKPPPEKLVATVEILNPIGETIVLADKNFILDIKARDQSGRLFNIEMQMVVHSHLPGRFLYYGTRLFSGQLHSGTDYHLLQPTISICFIDGLMFRQTGLYHLPFTLCHLETGIVYSDHLQMHIFQLRNFKKNADELADPLEKWLYFLNNGDRLDPDQLPETLQEPVYQEAARTLQMLTQTDLEREIYEAREKARLDALTLEREMERKNKALEEKSKALEEKSKALEQMQQQAEQAQQVIAASRAEGLIGKIRLCERFMKRAPTPEKQLKAMPLEQLQQLAEQLQHEALGQNGIS